VIGVNIAVIGMGLIGGSLLRVLAAAGHWVVGYDRDPATRAMARTGAAQAPKASRWQVAPSVAEAVPAAELVVIATPLTSVASVLDEIASAGYAGLVTDVVSVKEPMRELVARRLGRGGLRLTGYVGGHPMAGREKGGFAATDPALFDGCAWVLCIDEETSMDDWLTVARLVTGVGARVVATTAADHDRAVAAVSHVPHLVAAALATAIDDPLAATLAAGSFRDGTRVAAAAPELIASMCGGNAGPVLDALDAVLSRLDEARSGLDSADPIGALRRWLAPAYAARTTWPPLPAASRTIPATPDELLALGDEGGWVTAVAPDGRTVTAAGAVRPTHRS
jgi:prephenate dehydrogenase